MRNHDIYQPIELIYTGRRIPLCLQMSPAGKVVNVFCEPHEPNDMSKNALHVCNLINDLTKSGDTLQDVKDFFRGGSLIDTIISLALDYEKKAGAA